MKKLSINAIIGLALVLSSASAFAAGKCGLMTDPGVTSACQPVWSACESANVTDAKTGKTGYQPGEFKEGDGLWKNCVHPLAKGQTVSGLATPPSQQQAKACQQAAHNFRKANPGACK